MSDRVFLQQLYPEPGNPVTPNIDIVVVHGVNGDPIKTWECDNTSKQKSQSKPAPGHAQTSNVESHTDPGTSLVLCDRHGPVNPRTKDGILPERIIWPQDLLHRQPRLERARTFTFGYNGDVFHNDSVAGIRDLARTLLDLLDLDRKGIDARRPIVFVAHCLGGLIVKQALLIAQYERRYQHLADATAGISFLGTPHLANSKDNWSHLAKAYSALDSPRSGGFFRRIGLSHSKLVKALQKDSEQLVNLMDDFRHVLADGTRGVDAKGRTSLRWKIVNFCEQLPLPGAKDLIVDQTVADMAIPGAEPKPVHRDHVTMCQFGSDNEPGFKQLCSFIREMVPQEQSSTTRTGEENPRVNVQFNATVGGRGTLQINGTVTSVSYLAEGHSEQPSGGLQRHGAPLAQGAHHGNSLKSGPRQGYYLEKGQPEASTVRDCIRGTEASNIPVMAARSSVGVGRR
ncbi:uncharacterized protein PODANS_5_10945 [Podospora anserina S mat+]|uniref:Podospora anserina S mat+ genomic DNA chromosome 5, supercontig 10 n=1 Tax=Podospora anserina (strain S / ATCC MYA-4624 / DSM 980 / FGSC 10383) TaxID=515849 RepID=B2APR0_PODAN|nr:uncharacterized protein PODANS_5_10945 [Podospora anserina S mat+]CAP65889.1 unnamed protein product [Podospora anserina S mat+]CDP30248.1 Putative protein of unknown function [Podospora anserina S mat+]